MLRVLVVALVALVAAMFLLPHDAGLPTAATLLREPLSLPEIRLTDEAGHPFGLERLRGTYTLLFFGSTNDPDWRPGTVAAMQRTIAQHAPETAPRILFVSLDSGRDVQKQLAAYLRELGPAFGGAMADRAELEPWFEALKVSARSQHQSVAPRIEEPAVYVVGPDGAVLAIISSPHDPATLASDFGKIRRRWRITHRLSATA